MDFGNTQILNEILKFFQDASITGMLNLIPHAKALVCVLAIIDLCSTWALYDGEMKMSQMISKVMKLGAFLFIIMYWNDINHAIMVSFQYAGLTAANVPVNGDVIEPSKLLDNGFNVCKTLFDGLSSVGLNIGKALMYVITIGLVMFSFFIMALQNHGTADSYYENRIQYFCQHCRHSHAVRGYPLYEFPLPTLHFSGLRFRCKAYGHVLLDWPRSNYRRQGRCHS